MTYDAQRIAIQTRFDTQWKAAHPTVPIIYDNVKGKEPDGGFVQLRILNGASELAGLGLTKLYRYPGVISVDIFSHYAKALKWSINMRIPLMEFSEARAFQVFYAVRPSVRI